MQGLEIPAEVVDALCQGKPSPVTITINGHSWKSRVAIMRGCYLPGLSNANRQAAGVTTGDEIDVEVDLDVERFRHGSVCIRDGCRTVGNPTHGGTSCENCMFRRWSRLTE
jgi:hypothetical protein